MSRAAEYRLASLTDLEAINDVVEAAVMSWPMADRVKRLALPSLRYNESDLAHMVFIVCEADAEIIGVAAWDPFRDDNVALLHGLYVLPRIQRQGIGKLLIEHVLSAAAERRLDAVMVRAERVAVEYFRSQQFRQIEPADESEYPWQFIRPVPDSASAL